MYKSSVNEPHDLHSSSDQRLLSLVEITQISAIQPFGKQSAGFQGSSASLAFLQTDAANQLFT